MGPAINSVQGEICTIGNIGYTSIVTWQGVGREEEEREKQRAYTAFVDNGTVWENLGSKRE